MNKWVQRYFFFLAGLFINSFGIAFITKSALGTSQISSVPYVFSLYFTKLSFGTTTFIFNMLFILIQILLLRRQFQPIQFLQIIANILFSSFVDLGMFALSWFQPAHLVLRLVSLIIGCVILAFGISVEVAPGVIVVPGEGIVRAISEVARKPFGTIKVYFDVTLILIACCASFLLFHGLRGVGIGTVISAITVGKFVSIIDQKVPLIHYIEGLR